MSNNRKNMAKELAQEYNISANIALKIVDKVLDQLIDSTIQDGRIELRGFGVLTRVVKKSRAARNPKTGEPVIIPERLDIKFKPGKEVIQKLLRENHRNRN